MKKILLPAILAATMMAAGCVTDRSLGIGPGDESELAAVFNIPELKAATRVSYTNLEEGLVESMWVMVFNENGNYISRHRGETVEENPARYIFKNIPISEAGLSRTLHFVGNFDWDGFVDSSMGGLSENEVIGSMNVTGGRTAYWQRVWLADGLSGDPGDRMELEQTVHLLRNVAELTLENNTAGAGNGMSLTDVQFAVGDYLDKGSVAPFNSVLGSFGTGDPDVDTPASDFITEAQGGSVVALVEGDFVDALQSDGITPTPLEIYERNNSAATSQTYVIVKGKFQDGVTPNDSVWSYYKIDIVDPEATVLLDLRRNFRYKIDLTLVSNGGYGTLAEAVQNAAVNNINASVTVSEYTAVSDGRNVLRIENSQFVYVRPGQPFEIRYSYIDGSTGATNNSGIDIDLVETDPARPVVADNTFGYDIASSPWTGGRAGAIIRGTTADLPTGFDIYRASIRIAKGSLARVVQLQLRQAMNFTDVATSPADGVVPNVIGEQVSISFKMPVDISPALFPIPVYITSKRFVPDVAYNQLSVDVSGGDYRYVYYAPYLVDGNNQPLAHTIRLVSNTPNTEETVTISSEMFNDAFASFGNEMHDFVSTGFRNSGNTGDLKPRDAGNNNMRFYFTMPAHAGYPVTVTLVAPYLELRNGTSAGLTVTQSGNNGTRTMTMNISGPGEFYFTVRNSSTAGTNEQTPKYLQARFFNDRADLNAP